MDLCDICKRKPAKIHVEGEGDFCLDCYNAEILERIGKEDTFDYPRQITVMEPGGAVHTFDIEHVILGTLVSWEATEIAGNYSFRECSDIDENGAEVAERFLKKIVKGVCTKSLAIEDNRASNLVHKDGKTYRIEDKGVINIIEDEDNNFQPAFVVDGIKFTMEEFAELFGANIGFNIHFQIHDASDLLFGEDEYLVPIPITKESVIHELNTLINICSDRGFIDNKHVLQFDHSFGNIIKKLEILMEACEREKALEIGKEIIKILSAIETDDDYFPDNDIEAVCRTVDPFRIDSDLWSD